MRKLAALLIGILCMVFSASCFAEGDFIEATGRGYPAEFAMDEDIEYQRITAYEAAKIDAYSSLLEQIDGIRVDASSKVVNQRLGNKTVETKLSGVVKNAVVVGEEYRGRACIVTLRVPKFGGRGSVADAVIPEGYTPEPFTGPAGKTMPVSAGGYTGVIIDCRGVGNLVSAMSPVIENDRGSKIYGYKNLNRDFITKNGMAGYYDNTTAEHISSRVGSNPITVKAVSISREVNPVIAVADADKLLAENAGSHFLDRCAVAFLRDEHL